MIFFHDEMHCRAEIPVETTVTPTDLSGAAAVNRADAAAGVGAGVGGGVGEGAGVGVGGNEAAVEGVRQFTEAVNMQNREANGTTSTVRGASGDARDGLPGFFVITAGPAVEVRSAPSNSSALVRMIKKVNIMNVLILTGTFDPRSTLVTF